MELNINTCPPGFKFKMHGNPCEVISYDDDIKSYSIKMSRSRNTYTGDGSIFIVDPWTMAIKDLNPWVTKEDMMKHYMEQMNI